MSKQKKQNIPSVLYRGQGYLGSSIKEKYERVKELYKNGKLSELDPKELAEINISNETTSKKIVSTSSSEAAAANFLTDNKEEAFILKISNPEELADFYCVSDISAIPDEDEYLSRIPDDVALVPISIEKDKNQNNVVEVMCIRSEKALLDNSEQYLLMRQDLHKSLSNSLSIKTLNHTQKRLIKELQKVIKKTEAKQSITSAKEPENLFCESQRIMINLYNTSPNPNQKEILDKINFNLKRYSTVYSEMQATHHCNDDSKKIKENMTPQTSTKEPGIPSRSEKKEELKSVVNFKTRLHGITNQQKKAPLDLGCQKSYASNEFKKKLMDIAGHPQSLMTKEDKETLADIAGYPKRPMTDKEKIQLIDAAGYPDSHTALNF